MKRSTILIASLVIAAGSFAWPTIVYGTILPVPSSYSATSEYDVPYSAAKLFDSTVSDADLNATVYGAVDGQWAGVGPGPHQLFMDFGSIVTATGLAYAQRQGAFTGGSDKVGTIELWFSDASFGGSLPATLPQAVVHPIVPGPNTGVLVHYSLGGVHSGRYVAANFVALDPTIDPSVNNIGGSELRLTIPEPSSIIVAMSGAVLAWGLVRSARRR